MNTEIDSQPLNNRKLNKANKTSLIHRIINRNNVITKDSAIGDLAKFIAQNEYVKKWEFKQKTPRS